MHNATPLRVSIDGLWAVGVARQTTDLPRTRQTDTPAGDTSCHPDRHHTRIHNTRNTRNTHRHTGSSMLTTLTRPPRALAEMDPDQWMGPSPASPNSGPPKCSARQRPPNGPPVTPQARRENRRFAGPNAPLAGRGVPSHLWSISNQRETQRSARRCNR